MPGTLPLPEGTVARLLGGRQVLFRDTVPALTHLGPAFCSVTYGAGGGTKATTLRLVQRLRRDFGIEAMPHLTCSGSTRDMLRDVLDGYVTRQAALDAYGVVIDGKRIDAEQTARLRQALRE